MTTPSSAKSMTGGVVTPAGLEEGTSENRTDVLGLQDTTPTGGSQSPSETPVEDKPGNALLEAALKYARFGWSVIPVHSVTGGLCSCGNATCSRPGKHPRVRWKRYQSERATEEQVGAWWRRWPDANVGIVTGEVSGLAALDIDGDEGRRSLEAAGIVLPETVTSLTGGGGRHECFVCPADGVATTTQLHGMEGVDVRAEGGFVVAPPSMHARGVAYEWAQGRGPGEVKMAEWPGAILAVAAENSGLKWFNEAVDRVSSGGERNEIGIWLACQLRDARISQETARPFMTAYAKSVPDRDHPYTVREALASLGSAYSRPPREPARSDPKRGPTQAERLLRIASSVRYVKSQEPLAPIYAIVGGDIWPVESTRFRRWLLARYMDHAARPPQDSALRSALGVIAARCAEGQGVECADVGVRILGREGSIYLDLVDDGGHVVRITPQGWEIVTNPADVFLYRPQQMLPLPRPERGGGEAELQEFWTLLNVSDRGDQMQTMGWIVGTIDPHSPYPIMAPQGAQGSGKTKFGHMLRKIVDPVRVPARAPER